MRLSIILFFFLFLLSCGQNRTEVKEGKKIEKSPLQRQFVKVILNNSKIRSTPDLTAAVLERAKEGVILEYLHDSTTFTTMVINEGEKIESPWFYVQSESDNKGWISGICIEFMSDSENKRILTFREDSNSTKTEKIITNIAPKIDTFLLGRFELFLSKIKVDDSYALYKMISLFESVFSQKISPTADHAFIKMLELHKKIFSYYYKNINSSKYQYLASEIINYGSPNMQGDATCRLLDENALTFGIKNDGKVFLKQNLDLLMRKFLRLLSPNMQSYLEQLDFESNILYEDPHIVPLAEIASCTVFWDKYILKNPYSAAIEDAYKRRKNYATIIMNGGPGKPVFNAGQLNAEFKNVYILLTTKMGKSPIISHFQKYYKKLELANFKENAETIRLKNELLLSL